MILQDIMLSVKNTHAKGEWTRQKATKFLESLGFIVIYIDNSSLNPPENFLPIGTWRDSMMYVVPVTETARLLVEMGSVGML